jgi:hypothetical protein
VIRPLDRVDGALALFIFAAAASVAARYVAIPAVARGAAFYQEAMGPSVMWACGRGFVGTAAFEQQDTPPAHALTAFLARSVDRLDCSDLPSAIGPEPLTPFQQGTRYLLLAIGTMWRIRGVSWSGLSPLYALLFGVVNATAYLVMRAGMGRPIALGAAVILTTSPIQLINLPHLRDYMKVPFFVFTLLAISILAVRPTTSRALIIWAAGVGAVLGVGAGFRMDVNQYLALFCVVVVLFLPGAIREHLTIRLVAVSVSIGAFALTAAPILWSLRSGSNFWHVVLLGFASVHDDALGIRSPIYRVATLYDDSLISNTVNAYQGRIAGAVTIARLATNEYAAACAAYYRAIASVFPSDIVLRAWAAVYQVLWMPFTALSFGAPADVGVGGLVRLYRWRGDALWLAGHLMPWLPVAGVAALARVELRIAILVAACVIVFAGVTSLQFQLRHAFHLELLPIFLFGCAAEMGMHAARNVALRRPGGWTTGWGRVAIFAAALALLAVAPVAALRAYQQPNAEALLSRYLNDATVAIAARAEPLGEGRVRFALDGVTGGEGVAIPSQLLVVALSHAACGVPRAHVTIRYTAAAGIDFSRNADVAIPASDADRAHLLIPVIGPPADPREPQFQVAGLEMPESEAGCLREIRVLAHPRRFDLLLDASLPQGWQQQRLYETLVPYSLPPRP